jgi:hypothetical protein
VDFIFCLFRYNTINDSLIFSFLSLYLWGDLPPWSRGSPSSFIPRPSLDMWCFLEIFLLFSHLNIFIFTFEIIIKLNYFSLCYPKLAYIPRIALQIDGFVFHTHARMCVAYACLCVTCALSHTHTHTHTHTLKHAYTHTHKHTHAHTVLDFQGSLLSTELVYSSQGQTTAPKPFFPQRPCPGCVGLRPPGISSLWPLHCYICSVEF